MRNIIILCFYFFSTSIFCQTQVKIRERETESFIYYDLISTSVAFIRVELNSKKKLNEEIKYKEKVFLKSLDTVFGIISLPKKLNLNRAKVLKRFSIKPFWDSENEIVHDDDYLYLLPFGKRKKYEVSQSFNGKNSHFSVASKYAVDFAMPVGTKVFAARSGKVVFTIDQYKKSGGKKFTKKANKIVILHSDGTFGSYAHLKYQGALVKKGDYVERGQHIGYSGNTGFTRGPHLHFVVRKPDDTAVPIQFEGFKNKVLKKGKFYKRSQ